MTYDVRPPSVLDHPPSSNHVPVLRAACNPRFLAMTRYQPPSKPSTGMHTPKLGPRLSQDPINLIYAAAHNLHAEAPTSRASSHDDLSIPIPIPHRFRILSPNTTLRHCMLRTSKRVQRYKSRVNKEVLKMAQGYGRRWYLGGTTTAVHIRRSLSSYRRSPFRTSHPLQPAALASARSGCAAA
ncbi:hypothetical protein PSPO01_08889 [Paraphaeosphaeria sporulosa]